MQKIRVAIIGIGEKPGKTFIKNGLLYFLNGRRHRLIREEKYEIVEDPNHPEDYDLIVGVIDPLPEKVKEGISTYAKFNEPAWDTIWIVNKYNAGVNMRELEWFLKRKFNFTQEYVNPALIYSSQYLKQDFFSEEVENLAGVKRLADEIERKSVNFL